MAISPELILSLSKALKDKEKSDAIGAGLIKRTGEKFNGLVQGAGIFGNLMQATSDLPGQPPNVGQSAFGGALSGLTSGMAFGPIGAIAGAAIGGLGGYASGSKNLEEYLMGLNAEQKMNMQSKTVDPSMYEEGGEVEDVGIQTEKGEIILLASTLELVRSAAKEDHDDMKKNFISDFLPDGSEVFSNKLKFDPTKVADKVLGQGRGHYTEKETFAPEEIKVGSIFGDKEVTYAEAVDKLRKKVALVGKDTKDIFDNITDEENKLTRSMFLSVLIDSQNKDREDEAISTTQEVPMFRLGGKVRKYPDGGPVGSGVSAQYYSNVLKKLEELRGKNEDNLATGKEDLSKLAKRMRGSILAQAGTETLFTALQNPRVTPVVQDNTFINEAFQQQPLSFIESQVAPIRGSASSMAQSLIASGVDPRDVPSMVAGTQGRALETEGRMRTAFAQDRVNTDRGRFAALRANLTQNRANVVNAQNETTTNENQRFANFGSIISNAIGSSRGVAVGEMTGNRNLMKEYNDNDLSMFQTQTNIEGDRFKFDDNMRRINERLDSLNAERGRLSQNIDRRSGLLSSLTQLPSRGGRGELTPNTNPFRITQGGVQGSGITSFLPSRGMNPVKSNNNELGSLFDLFSGNTGNTSSSQPNIEQILQQLQMDSIPELAPGNAPNQSTYW